MVTRDSGPSGTPPDFDVCVAGGTLGILIALALQLRGHRVCVVEKRLLQGRSQVRRPCADGILACGSRSDALQLLLTRCMFSSSAFVLSSPWRCEPGSSTRARFSGLSSV